MLGVKLNNEKNNTSTLKPTFFENCLVIQSVKTK